MRREQARHSMASRMREGFVEGAGARIYFKTMGRGAPLLLLHGGPGADHSDFLPALKPLAKRHQLILIDERGSGRSERLKDPASYTLRLMVEDIECVRKHLKLEHWVVLGHSFGGILAQAYAVRHPGRLLGLVLAGAGSSARCIDADFRNLRKGLPAALRSRLANCERAGIFQANGAYTRRYAAASARAIAPYMHASKPLRRFNNPPPLGMEVLREMWVRRSDFHIDGNLKGFDFRKALTRVKVPSLIVIGDRDLVSTRTADISRASLPRATLVVMAESAHMMFIDQTDRFNRLLEEFMSWCAMERRGRTS
jgi:proline iminopeptidase